MNRFTGLLLGFRPTWLTGALGLLAATACAVAPPPESPYADPVDVGYGQLDREQLTGSVTTVEGEDEATRRARTLVEMLSRVPGLRVIERPGGLTVRIRGSTSFLADEEPLLVLDGMAMEFQAGIDALNPNAIESITVLKDAGDTAIYGSRGANGVILVRSRRGGN
jgi:TonB-dependent SusC/RagA subfamily outer membrane receptor